MAINFLYPDLLEVSLQTEASTAMQKLSFPDGSIFGGILTFFGSIFAGANLVAYHFDILHWVLFFGSLGYSFLLGALFAQFRMEEKLLGRMSEQVSRGLFLVWISLEIFAYTMICKWFVPDFTKWDNLFDRGNVEVWFSLLSAGILFLFIGLSVGLGWKLSKHSGGMKFLEKPLRHNPRPPLHEKVGTPAAVFFGVAVYFFTVPLIIYLMITTFAYPNTFVEAWYTSIWATWRAYIDICVLFGVISLVIGVVISTQGPKPKTTFQPGTTLENRTGTIDRPAYKYYGFNILVILFQVAAFFVCFLYVSSVNDVINTLFRLGGGSLLHALSLACVALALKWKHRVVP